MTVEYILLAILTVMYLMKAVVLVPQRSFKEAGPRLGVRIEQQLETGSGFKDKGKSLQWSAPPQ